MESLGNPRPKLADALATADLLVDRATIDGILMQRHTPAQAAEAGLLRVEGAPGTFARFWALLDRFEPVFPIIEPHPGTAGP